MHCRDVLTARACVTAIFTMESSLEVTSFLDDLFLVVLVVFVVVQKGQTYSAEVHEYD